MQVQRDFCSGTRFYVTLLTVLLSNRGWEEMSKDRYSMRKKEKKEEKHKNQRQQSKQQNKKFSEETRSFCICSVERGSRP